MNTKKIIKKRQVVYGIIIEINQVILFQLILNLLNTSITGNTYNVPLTIIGDGGNPFQNPNYDANKVGKKETEIVIPLKHLSNFWKNLNIPLINCEVEIILIWSKNCVLADMTARNAGNNDNPPVIVEPTRLEFQIKDIKLDVPVVTLSKENDLKLLEKLKLGF